MRLVVIGGERAGTAALAAWRRAAPGVPLINAYGLTESAVTSTLWRDDGGELDGPSLPVGRPLPNQEAQVMDGEGRPQPDGVAGELWIGGAGLAEGYWRQPEATAARFPLHDAGDGTRRWLRTGDLARRRDDGTLEILGRIDDQVQVRGFRVELGEVEATLEAHPAVRRAAAALDGDRLVAWVEGPARQDDLLRLARRRLPSWMAPSAIGVLDALPLTPSGKVDRRALLAAPPPPPPAARPPRGRSRLPWRRCGDAS